MLSSRHHTWLRPSGPKGIRTRVRMTLMGGVREQAETVSAINRQHVTAISRLLSVMDIARKAATDDRVMPRLRDTCKAKAEIMLSSEETDVLRSYLVASKDA